MEDTAPPPGHEENNANGIPHPLEDKPTPERNENGNNDNSTSNHNSDSNSINTNNNGDQKAIDDKRLSLNMSGLNVSMLNLSVDGGESSNGPKKKSVEDFNFGQVLGEGAYGAVVLGTDKDTGSQYAIKILEKKHIMKENKQKYVKTERDILCMCSHPNIVKLFYTFRASLIILDYVLELCPNGELLSSIRKLGSFAEDCIRFYAAEIINVLEYLHSKGIVHRDLKPENILMSGDWHIKLTDFGTATILGGEKNARSGSFVGTPEYMSPELINSRACTSSDLWALGVIIYQMYTNKLPFQGKTNFLTFQKVSNRDIIYPKEFPAVAKDLIEQLLVTDPDGRLGARTAGYSELKAHPFFEGIDWDNLHTQQPPPLRKLPIALIFEEVVDATTPPPSPSLAPKNAASDTPANREEAKRWVSFLQPDEGIIYSGVVWKRKGLSVKKRRLLLTDMTRLIYIDEKRMELKGEIPWSDQLRPELKNSANFWIHTPKRKYILEDATNNATQWVEIIQKTLEKR